MTLPDSDGWMVGAVLIAATLLGGVLLLRATDGLRRTVVIALRVVLLLLLVAALLEPSLRREHDDVSTVILLDVSGSVRRFGEIPGLDATDVRDTTGTLGRLRSWLDAVAATRRPDDRLGVVVFDGETTVLSPPRRGALTDDSLDVVGADGTDIAGAIRLGVALMPPDTSRRLVLVSDGNETAGDALRTVREIAAPSEVTVDVAPIIYGVRGDTQIDHIDAPSSARPGETVRVRIHLDSSDATSGRLVLLREGEPVDLNAAAPGRSRRIDVPAGPSVQVADVPLGSDPVTRLVAVFEPDDQANDLVPENNRAEAVIAMPNTGAVLLVHGGVAEGDSPLADLLDGAGMPVFRVTAAEFPPDLLAVQGYDLIVLDDVAAHQLDLAQQDAIAEYVDRLGGGLLVTGGPHSFAAGGWKGSPVEPILPVALDVPRELRRPTAALVLVLDKSGSMNASVAGARATQQEIANEGAALAIESLGTRSYVGVIAFDQRPQEVVPLQINDDPEAMATRVRGIGAQGGTELAPALQAAADMLATVPEVEQRVVVFLTDGQSRGGSPESVVRRMAADGIEVTTIAVGDGADHGVLRELAEIGNGRFFPVRDPRVLPRVLVDSVQVVNRPLIREEPFLPLVQPTGSRLASDLLDAPSLLGTVITAVRPDPRAVVELMTPENEPVLARWQAGLGRVVAFTSSLEGPWAASWLEWPGWSTVWLELVRSTARPAFGRGLIADASMEPDGLRVSVEVDRTPAGDAIDPTTLTFDAVVHQPSGRRVPLRLRQTSPTRFECRAPAGEPGPYVVTVLPTAAERALAPLVAGASRAGGAELRRFRSDVAALRAIAEETDGRLVDLADPSAVNLFDPAGRPTTVSIRPLWPVFLWLALGAFMLDVAVRRVSWSGAEIVAWWRRMIGAREIREATALPTRAAAEDAPVGSPTAGPARSRAPAVDGTAPGAVSAPAPVPSPTSPGTGAEATMPSPDPEPSQKAPARPTPSREQVEAALAALRGTAAPPPPPAVAESTPPPAPADASETTSGLLAAKRRAQERLEEDQT